jgi:hypothetical protein
LRKKCTSRYRNPPGYQTDQNRTSPCHSIIKTISTENKERILKAVREKNQITYKGKPIKITTGFSTETLKARRAWNEIFQEYPRILYSAKLLFKLEGGIKTFHDK